MGVSVGEAGVYCVFIGHHRSGHSVIGALLDAHPDIIIPHEYHALLHVKKGCTKRELFMALVATSFKQAHEGRREGKYSYVVPGQWQGRYRELRVIGDKKGSGTTDLLIEDPGLLGTTRRLVERDLRILYVTRNPFDNLASQLRYAPHPLSNEQIRRTIEHYFLQVETNARVLREWGEKALCFRHEDFLAEPAPWLRRLCIFLGVEPIEDYIRDCAAIVYESPHKSRNELEWSSELVNEILERMRPYGFLDVYRFDG